MIIINDLKWNGNSGKEQDLTDEQEKNLTEKIKLFLASEFSITSRICVK